MTQPLPTLEYQHSRGPWRASFFGGRWCVLHKGGDDTTILAECGNEADARIMAASLDMLDAISNSDDAHWTTAMRSAMAKAGAAR